MNNLLQLCVFLIFFAVMLYTFVFYKPILQKKSDESGGDGDDGGGISISTPSVPDITQDPTPTPTSTPASTTAPTKGRSNDFTVGPFICKIWNDVMTTPTLAAEVSSCQGDNVKPYIRTSDGLVRCKDNNYIIVEATDSSAKDVPVTFDILRDGACKYYNETNPTTSPKTFDLPDFIKNENNSYWCIDHSYPPIRITDDANIGCWGDTNDSDGDKKCGYNTCCSQPLFPSNIRRDNDAPVHTNNPINLKSIQSRHSSIPQICKDWNSAKFDITMGSNYACTEEEEGQFYKNCSELLQCTGNKLQSVPGGARPPLGSKGTPNPLKYASEKDIAAQGDSIYKTCKDFGIQFQPATKGQGFCDFDSNSTLYSDYIVNIPDKCYGTPPPQSVQNTLYKLSKDDCLHNQFYCVSPTLPPVRLANKMPPVLQKTNYSGGVIDPASSPTVKKSIEDCYADCLSNPDCITITYEQSSGKCWLKRSGTTQRTSNTIQTITNIGTLEYLGQANDESVYLNETNIQPSPTMDSNVCQALCDVTNNYCATPAPYTLYNKCTAGLTWTNQNMKTMFIPQPTYGADGLTPNYTPSPIQKTWVNNKPHSSDNQYCIQNEQGIITSEWTDYCYATKAPGTTSDTTVWIENTDQKNCFYNTYSTRFDNSSYVDTITNYCNYKYPNII